MKSWEKIDQPHAVYRLSGLEGELLYIGCSMTPFTRMGNHIWTKPWGRAITRVDIKWYPDWLSASRAETAGILKENPPYNRTDWQPEQIGARPPKSLSPARGDGVHCPKCGISIENKRKGKAYCNSCSAKYSADWRAKRDAALLTLKRFEGRTHSS